MLDIKNITKSFNKANVLRNVSLTIGENDIICLLGKTGKGKTTLFNIICGLDKDFEGTIQYNILQSEIEYVFQDDILLPWSTVKDNIWLGVDLKRNLRNEELFSEIVNFLELDKYLKHFPYQLSGGTKRRVSIARALVNNPRLLVLDEPFNGLDFETKAKTEQLLLLFINSKSLKSIIYSSHFLESSVNFSTKIILLGSDNSIDELTIQPELKDSIIENIQKLRDMTIYSNQTSPAANKGIGRNGG